MAPSSVASTSRLKSPIRTKCTASPVLPSGRRRVLFVSSNGVGLGHLTRLLAIARRLPAHVEPVFATMSPALSIVEQFGFAAEFLQPHQTIGTDMAAWDRWLRREIEEAIAFHDAGAVVFDGPFPFDGLIRAVAPRSDCRLIWVRRSMWRATRPSEVAMARSRYFDLVIEPEDVAEAQDQGATTAHRGAVLRVPPVRLLDEAELLPRRHAARELGLDPRKLTVLIQLGSGSNREIASLTDRIIAALAAEPEIQIVNAEWLIGESPLDLWPGVTNLRSFPVSRYFRAFDLSISHAGYNSFNEVISFGLPTAFVPNDNPRHDDQEGRAAFAESEAAAVYLRIEERTRIGQIVRVILDERARALFRKNCKRLARANGAAAAAAAVADQIGGGAGVAW